MLRTNLIHFLICHFLNVITEEISPEDEYKLGAFFFRLVVFSLKVGFVRGRISFRKVSQFREDSFKNSHTYTKKKKTHEEDGVEDVNEVLEQLDVLLHLALAFPQRHLGKLVPPSSSSSTQKPISARIPRLLDPPATGSDASVLVVPK